MRRQTFRTMLQTALSPLSQLQTSPNGIYARTIKDNLRKLLGSGQGLPLLFPKHELDFSYDESARLCIEENETDHWSRDSIASSPRLAPGMLFPHIMASVPLETLRRFPRLQPTEDESGGGRSLTKVSTRDLAAQLSSNQTPWAFCLLGIIGATEDSMVDKNATDKTLSILKTKLEGRFGIPLSMARLIVSDDSDAHVEQLNQSNHEEDASSSICNMYVSRCQWKALNLMSVSSKTSSFVVIRPDGHVAAVSSTGVHIDNLIPGIQTSIT